MAFFRKRRIGDEGVAIGNLILMQTDYLREKKFLADCKPDSGDIEKWLDDLWDATKPGLDTLLYGEEMFPLRHFL